jgi:2-phosphoglycerate kinase
MLSQELGWKVLLIGGNSGAGKTVVARHLAQRFGVGLAETDDFRLVLERMTIPEQQPALHRLLALLDVDAQVLAQPQVVRDALIDAAKVVSHALEIVVANHVATDTPTILEGDGILPALAAQHSFAGLDVKDAVRAVFLIERDKDQLFQNIVNKGRSFEQLPVGFREHYIDVSWRYGQWLRRKAVWFGLPVVAPRPWETLEERVLGAIEPTAPM